MERFKRFYWCKAQLNSAGSSSHMRGSALDTSETLTPLRLSLTTVVIRFAS